MFFGATCGVTTVNHRIVSQATAAEVVAGSDERWQALGFGVGPTERTALAAFLAPLNTRGLAGLKLVVLEAHTELIKAIGSVDQCAAEQRCPSRFMRNVLSMGSKGSQDVVASTIEARPPPNLAALPRPAGQKPDSNDKEPLP